MKQPGWQDFLTLCVKSKDTASLDAVFDLLFTPEEKSDMGLRCLIVRELLTQHKPQREIAKALKVSIAKITRGSNALKRISPNTQQYLLKQLLK